MLDNLKNIIEGLKGLNTGAEIEKIVLANQEAITELQKKQLYEGRGVDGNYIKPLYSENPYFKKPGAAQRYAEWKQRITPDPRRPADVPNLFINGTFYDTLVTRISSRMFEIEPNSIKGKEIFTVHSNAEGLDPESLQEFRTDISLPEFLNIVNQKTGLNLR